MAVAAEITAAFLSEDDTDEWLRNSPWGTTPFQEDGGTGWFSDGTYADAANDLFAFRLHWHSLTHGPDMELNAPRDGTLAVAAVTAPPSQRSDGDLHAVLELQGRIAAPMNDDDVATSDWFALWRTEAAGSDGPGTTLLAKAIARANEGTEWEPHEDGRGYRLVLPQGVFQRLAKGVLAQHGRLSTADHQNARDDAPLQVHFNARLRLQRAVVLDGDTRWLPVAGGPHDGSEDNTGYFATQLNDVVTIHRDTAREVTL